MRSRSVPDINVTSFSQKDDAMHLARGTRIYFVVQSYAKIFVHRYMIKAVGDAFECCVRINHEDIGLEPRDRRNALSGVGFGLDSVLPR